MTTAFGVYPIADALTEGEEISSTYEGRHVTLDASEVISAAGSGQCTKGLPVIFGRTGLMGVGIAFDTVTSGPVAMDTEGIWVVDVYAQDDGGGSAVAGGDDLYIDITAGSCVVSKIASAVTNIPFGYALGIVGSGLTETIAVKVHWDPIDNWLLDNEPLLFGDVKDLWMIHRGGDGSGGVLCTTEWTVPGSTGRTFESQLTVNALLGNYANALKGYLDCDVSGGSAGLLSGINGEIRLPNAAGAGAYFALEGEVVFQTSSTIDPYGSTAGFLHLGITPAGTAEFDNDGVFMSVWGLTNDTGHILSLDYHTLRCDFYIAAHLTKYLVLSLQENYIDHFFSAIADDDRIFKLAGTWATPDSTIGEGLVNITVSITGLSGNHANLTSKWINLVGAEIAGYLTLANDGFWDSGTANLAASFISLHKYEINLSDNPQWLSIYELNMQNADSAIDAIFNCNNIYQSLGYDDGDATGTDGSIPFCSTAGGAIKYIMLYSGHS